MHKMLYMLYNCYITYITVICPSLITGIIIIIRYLIMKRESKEQSDR